MLMRVLATIAIVVAGACTMVMNWRFSFQLGTTEFDSYTWAAFSVALDISKWLMLPTAAVAWPSHKLRSLAAIVIWIVATVYSFTAAIGFAALNRDATTSVRQHQVELHQTLEIMKKSPRWQSSAACADATSPSSKEFCASYRAVEASIGTVPQDADPQSAFFSRLSGLQPEMVRVVLNFFLAIACEVISALGMFAIMPVAQVVAKTPSKSWKPPSWQDIAPPRRGPTRPALPQRDAPRPSPT